uniref:Uncharacterized protein n=1 Tax=Timema shepardi TaxID=629360 RepID=A0A7R9FVJ2_TIMSH|nr:unnamed protein product [Timema shepardi]
MVTCVMDLGVCAVSCMQNADDRKAEVRTLYNTGTYDESAMLRGCQGGSSLTPDGKQDNNTSYTSDRRFINAGIWVSSIVFLAMALFMSLVSAGFGVYNAAFNPIETYLAVPGLYIWNGIAVVQLEMESNWSIEKKHLGYVERMSVSVDRVTKQIYIKVECVDQKEEVAHLCDLDTTVTMSHKKRSCFVSDVLWISTSE